MRKAGVAMRGVGAVIWILIQTPAGARDLSCPETIGTGQSLVGAAPAGWRAAVDKSAGAPLSHWAGVEFSDGPPENLASLAPDDSQTAGGNRVDIYKFPASVYRQIFLSCTYGQTSVILTRNPAVVGSVCRVTYEGAGSDAGPVKIECSP